jgi:hypothetical protein
MRQPLPESLLALPNVGPAMAADLRLLGIEHAAQLHAVDPFELHQQFESLTGHRQDPCVLDTFIALTRYVAGDPTHPWWHYTAERKATLAARRAVRD